MKIGFIGAGNMGGALISGLLKSGKYDVFVFDIHFSNAEAFEKNGAHVCKDVLEIADQSDILILTVKPNVYPIILDQLNQIAFAKRLVTVAPGITVADIQKRLPNAKIVRTMPNTPALVGEGITLIAQSHDQALQNEVQEILNCVGKTAVLQEHLMDAGTALSGSSPALVYKLIEIMANSALSYGIPKQEGIKIAAQTVLGSAKMVLETNLHPSMLSDNVCSPGGTTIALMNELAKHGFESAILSAMDRCVDKARNMKK